jgi:hypothetical protein
MERRTLTDELEGLIARWVATGIVTSEQAERMRADAAIPRGRRAAPVVTEALAYLGAAIVMVGLVLVTGWFWQDLSTATRVGLTGAVAALFVGAGAAVPRSLGAVGGRLRSVLWLGSSVATYAALALLAGTGFGWSGDEVAAFAGGITMVAAGALWLLHRWPPQQAALLAAALITTGGAMSMATDDFLATMVVVWAVAAGWLTLAWLNVLPPRRPGIALGAVATIIASMTLESEDWGVAIALTTVVVLVALAVWVRDLVLLALASVGMLGALPTAIVQYFPGVLAAAIALVLVGLLLVTAAVFTARHRRPRPPRAQPGAAA